MCRMERMSACLVQRRVESTVELRHEDPAYPLACRIAATGSMDFLGRDTSLQEQ